VKRRRYELAFICCAPERNVAVDGDIGVCYVWIDCWDGFCPITVTKVLDGVMKM
jgi:hypothetical protein